jgi:hypothetical protein
MSKARSGNFFVPHDLDAPLMGAASGPLAGLTAAVKDMYDIKGARTGGGSPEWLAVPQLDRLVVAAAGDGLAVGAKATVRTQPVCPARVRRHWPVWMFHSLRVWSSLLLASSWLSGLKASDQTGRVCPLKVNSFLRSATCQRWMLLA